MGCKAPILRSRRTGSTSSPGTQSAQRSPVGREPSTSAWTAPAAFPRDPPPASRWRTVSRQPVAQFARCTSSAPHGGSGSRKSSTQNAAGSPPEKPHRHTPTMGASTWAHRAHRPGPEAAAPLRRRPCDVCLRREYGPGVDCAKPDGSVLATRETEYGVPGRCAHKQTKLT